MNRKPVRSLLGSPSSNPRDLTSLLGIQSYNPNAQMPSPTDRMMRPTPQVGLPQSQLQQLAQPTLFGRVRQGVSDAGKDLKKGLLDFTTGPYSDERMRGLSSALLAPSVGRKKSFGERLMTGITVGSELENEKRLTEETQKAAKLSSLLESERLKKLKQENARGLLSKNLSTGLKQAYDPTGKSVILQEIETPTGVKYIDPNTNLFADFSILTLDKPAAAQQEDVKEIYNKKTGENIFALKKRSPTGGIEYVDYGSGNPIDLNLFTFNRPTSDKTSQSTKKPFSVELKKPFAGQEAGTQIVIQSKTKNGIEKMYASVGGEDVEITTDVYTTDYLSPKQILEVGLSQIPKLNASIDKENSAIRGLDKFLSLAEEADVTIGSGAKFRVTGIMGKINKFMGKDLTDEQKIISFLSSKQQGTLGALRLEILGPGVLTETDAERVILAMGTDFDSWFADPGTLKKTLLDIRNSKLDAAKKLVARRNSWSRGEVPKSELNIFPPTEWFTKDKATYEEWNVLTTEEKQQYIDSI